MAVSFAYPWVLLLALLALIPFWRSNQTRITYSSLVMIPFDGLSAAVSLGIKLIGAAVILLLVLGLADPYYPQQSVQKIGNGAQIVLLIDRSASMNENFAGRYFGGMPAESKVAIARDILIEFVLKRPDDFFGMISFSTTPIHVMPLTQDKTAILAAIKATKSRGRGVTNIAPGLSMALSYFSDQPLTGSRVILLVSDGAARIDTETQTTLTQMFQQNKVMLYWVYLRNKKKGALDKMPVNANETSSPEYFLHQYFLSMSIPYQAFEAESRAELQRVIEKVGALENKSLLYTEKIPRHSQARQYFLLAIGGMLLLLLVQRLQVNKL
jgi:mxaC protein